MNAISSVKAAGSRRRSAAFPRPSSSRPRFSRKPKRAAAQPPIAADRLDRQILGGPLSEAWLALVAGVPTLLILAMAATRALLSRSDGIAAGLERTFPGYETVLDWAVHFAVGAMVLAISTALVVEHAASPVALIGFFTGVIAACFAFVMARPPVRPDAQNPELDVRSFGLSVAAHSVAGLGLASLLIAAS